uniref:Uncharacterized protein n=1 Tax=Romanomermis culicivorax TaxID=13658 RepID=A0A915ICY3_ROMCU
MLVIMECPRYFKAHRETNEHVNFPNLLKRLFLSSALCPIWTTDNETFDLRCTNEERQPTSEQFENKFYSIKAAINSHDEYVVKTWQRQKNVL